MEPGQYRRAALERLSSPDQIDEVLRISTSKEWLAMVAIGLVLATSGTWAVFGILPAKASGQGVLVHTGGLLNVVSLRGGLVMSVDAKVGARVKAGQVLAKVAQPTLIDRIASTRLELEQLLNERTWAVRLAHDGAALQADALALQRTNTKREISELEARVVLALQQIAVADRLLAEGLVTTQQTIAARQHLIDLRQEIAARQARLRQFDAQEFAIRASPRQTDAERREKIRHTELALASLEKELELSQNVVAPSAGKVVELQVDPGSMAAADSAILTLQPESTDLEALVCVPAHAAKNVSPGMAAEVSPSPVRREEYGFIRGVVIFVADYPATSAALMRILQNPQLVQSLTAHGPVTEVRVRLIRDETAPRGYRWSSSRGPSMSMTSGTLASVQIITREQRPIDLLLPYTRKATGLD